MKNIVIVIIILAVGGGAFYGGTVYEKSNLQKQGMLRGSGNNLQPGQGRQGGAGRFGGGGTNGQNGGFANGQIISTDSNNITIKSQDGSSKIVYFSGSTSIGKAVSGTSADLSNGEQVIVNGTSNSDDSIAAQNIQIRPGQPSQNQ